MRNLHNFMIQYAVTVHVNNCSAINPWISEIVVLSEGQFYESHVVERTHDIVRRFKSLTPKH